MQGLPQSFHVDNDKLIEPMYACNKIAVIQQPRCIMNGKPLPLSFMRFGPMRQDQPHMHRIYIHNVPALFLFNTESPEAQFMDGAEKTGFLKRFLGGGVAW